MANNAQSEVPSFTTDEFHQILAFLRDGKIQPQANVTGLSTPFCYSSNLPSHYSNEWIIDTGATDHIVSSPNFLNNLLPSHSTSVRLPNGAKVDIMFIGTTKISPNLSFSDVLCVSSFRVNLLSVSKITRSLNCSITFFLDFCILQDMATKRMSGPGLQVTVYITFPQVLLFIHPIPLIAYPLNMICSTNDLDILLPHLQNFLERQLLEFIFNLHNLVKCVL